MVRAQGFSNVSMENPLRCAQPLREGTWLKGTGWRESYSLCICMFLNFYILIFNEKFTFEKRIVFREKNFAVLTAPDLCKCRFLGPVQPRMSRQGKSEDEPGNVTFFPQAPPNNRAAPGPHLAKLRQRSAGSGRGRPPAGEGAVPAARGAGRGRSAGRPAAPGSRLPARAQAPALHL